MYVQWSDEKYSLGIPDVDRQHREFFLITNQIYEAGMKENNRPFLIPLMKRIYAYTRYHFSSELSLFRYFEYPDAKEHNRVHADFTRRVKVFLEDFRDYPQIPVDEVLDFLVNWIISHIMGEDRKYSDYFREKGINPELHFSLQQGGNLDDSAMELWQDQQLALEISTIDNQHKELVYILQQFNDLQKAAEGRRRSFTPPLIEKLFYYSEYHFSYEEELMSKHHYPETLQHRELHQDFIMRIKDFVREYNLRKESLNDEIIFFLKDWTINHILKEDRKYQPYLA